MNKSTLILGVFSLLFAFGCKQNAQQPDDESVGGGFDPQAMSRVSQTACPQGQTLNVDTSTTGNFEQLSRSTRYFGFSRNANDCILESNVDEMIDTPQYRLTFKVTLPGSCLTNRSLWILVSSTAGENATHIDVLQRQDVSQFGYLTVNAAAILGADYLKSRLGMVALHCR